MGAIWLRGGVLLGGLSDLVGYKLGLTVNEEQLREAFLRAGLIEAWPEDLDQVHRYRSEVYEEIARAMLAQFGDPDAEPANVPPVMAVMRAVPLANRDLAETVISDVLSHLPPLIAETAPQTAIDPTSLLETIGKKYGPDGVHIAVLLLERLNSTLFVSPWSRVRREEWPDTLALSELFLAEHTTASLGRFFDQRFIDYLEANFSDVDDINWRRFEALVAEYLDRTSWQVELGPGRNDDGVDVRAWSTGADAEGPATVLVQCKRERRKISKVVVKALAADVQWHGAEVGLLVTTSACSPGARAAIETRDYPIQEADRDVVRDWVRMMRTPGTGVWLGG